MITSPMIPWRIIWAIAAGVLALRVIMLTAMAAWPGARVLALTSTAGTLAFLILLNAAGLILAVLAAATRRVLSVMY
jgi:hypothetical protein